MTRPAPSHPAPISFYRSGELLRSRSVSEVVLVGMVDVPEPPARLLADWEREISSQLALEPGDVEPLPLARARTRWPAYRLCVQAASDWAHAQGLPGVLASSEIALMACQGAKYHHDGMQYGFAAFCNLFMSEDKGLDLHFPAAGKRIPLRRGTMAIFDTGQPHAVIRRGSSGFDEADFADGSDHNLVFLSWELPIEEACVAKVLRIEFDIAPAHGPLPGEESLMLGGRPAVVHPAHGQWMRED